MLTKLSGCACASWLSSRLGRNGKEASKHASKQAIDQDKRRGKGKEHKYSNGREKMKKTKTERQKSKSKSKKQKQKAKAESKSNKGPLFPNCRMLGMHRYFSGMLVQCSISAVSTPAPPGSRSHFFPPTALQIVIKWIFRQSTWINSVAKIKHLKLLRIRTTIRELKRQPSQPKSHLGLPLTTPGCRSRDEGATCSTAGSDKDRTPLRGKRPC